MAHKCPSDLPGPYVQGFVVLEQDLVGPKTDFCVRQAQRRVFAKVPPYPDPWSSPGTIDIYSNIYFVESALLEGGTNQLTECEQRQFSPLVLALPPPKQFERHILHTEGVTPNDAPSRPIILHA
jgi:hypothetical protein